MKNDKMKAVIYEKYGTPEVLQFKELRKPSTRKNEVLVKIHAVSINYPDFSFVRGQPFLVRFMGAGLLKPKNKILGSDIAGEVEAVGRNIKQFRPGDEVYGDISPCGWGGFAEYVSVPETVLAHKPINISFEEAAAVPMAGVVALQGLRDKGQIQPGQKVLINGASGGNGSFAVQIAKSFNTEVTGVCGTNNLEMVRSMGADHVIDYKKEDFTKNGKNYDLILDVPAHHSIFDYKRALSSDGTFVFVGGSMTTLLQVLLLGRLVSINNSKKYTFLYANPNQEDLIFLKELIEGGEVKPFIDRCYPLNETSEALKYYGEGHTRGKVVIKVEDDKS